MKGKRVWSLLGLAACIIVLALSMLQLNAIGNDLQYLIPAPAMAPAAQGDTQGQENAPAAKPNQAALTLWENLKTTAEKWTGVMKTYSLSGIVEKASFTSDTGETKQARLTALSENAFIISPQFLHFGRLFYPEELEKGADLILLDEQLALALFKISDPIGRKVNVSGVDFIVAGILRHTKQVGDGEDYGAYVPLAHLWTKEIQLQALQVTARPIPGAGARSIFSTAMDAWQAGGTKVDLGKEAMGALLPLRVLLFFLGITLFFRLLTLWNKQFFRFFADYRQRLIREYAVRLMPRLSLGILALALGYGALALYVSYAIQFLVEPVYTFTEWVPAVLVEWKDIQTAFWQVWQTAGSLRELRSPELNRIRFFGLLTAWSSGVAAVILTSFWVRWWTARQQKQTGL